MEGFFEGKGVFPDWASARDYRAAQFFHRAKFFGEFFVIRECSQYFPVNFLVFIFVVFLLDVYHEIVNRSGLILVMRFYP